jgi:hypothetical protein
MPPVRPYYLPFALAALVFLSSCGVSKDNTVKTFEMGSRVEAGHLIYTVFETQWLSQIGAGDTARVPRNRFFLIRIAAVNSGSDEEYVPNPTLVDDRGQTVDELQDGEQVPQWIGFVRKVKPADSISGNIVFDAEPKHYRLRVTDENGEKPALIDIPLNFNADSSPVPVSSGGLSGSTPTDLNSPAKK